MMIVDEWVSEWYFVATPRSDGTAPDFVKSIDNKVHFSFEEAEQACKAVCKKYGPFYKIFTAKISVPRQLPIENPPQH